MSKAEVERFISDLDADSAKQAEVQAEAASVPALVKFAKERGYDITIDDIHEHARSQNPELTDEQLDTAAGGRSRGGEPYPFPIPIIVVVILRPY
jgi:predicted ribosomally synthesized peptide with nif11-like leader